MNIKTVIIKRSQNLKTFLIVLALAISSMVAVPSTAAANAPYDGTNGIVSCGTGGYFTISSNVVTSNSSCDGSVAIPNGVTRIGNGALAGVSNLSSITISNTVTTIEDNAFSQLGYVTFQQYPNNDYVSTNNATITSLVIPDTVTSIGVRAFYGLTTITSLTLSNNVTAIPQEAFFGMSHLLSLTIPNSVTSIGPSSFYIMSRLTSLTISENISTIPIHAFAGMYAIQTINIPNSVTSIGYEAFSYPRGLSTLNLGTGLTSIGAQAFIGPLSLTAIVIPNSVTTIGDSAFSMDWVNVLSSITIGNNVVSIGATAFAGANGVTSLTLPSSVTFIGINAFFGHASSFTFNYCGNASVVGTGLPNPASNAASCAPAPPTNLTATTANATANISFTEGATFGEAITNYEYSLNNGAFTAFSPVDTTTPVSITGLTNGTTYSIRLRGVNARGTGAASTPISVTLPPTCAQGGTCAVGDIGPGGGLVFYVSSTFFGCGLNHADDCKYLEVAPKNWSGAATDPDLYWHLNGLVIDGISRDSSPNMAITEVGLGLLNSKLIAASDTSTSNASFASRAYNGGGKSDWYLPTIAELGALCRYAYGQSPIFSSTCDYNQTLNTGIPSAYTFERQPYQSSSQAVGGNAQWHQNFVSGADGNSAQQSTWGYPATTYKARPIRAFAAINTVADGTTSCGTTGTFTILNKVVTSSTSDCSGSVAIPYGVTSIADAAFWQRAITTISLPNTVATIGDSSLRQTSLTTISIPGSVQSIGFLAFGTTPLSSVTFASASNLTTLGAYAFQSSVFTTITLPAAVTTMGTGVFQLNNNLNDITFTGIIPSGSPWDTPSAVNISGKVACGSNGYFVIVSNGVAGNYDCRGSVNIPVGVTGISSSAFDAHPSDGSAGQQNRYGSTMTPQVTSLTIPNTVTAIGSFAFRQSSLISLTIPNSVTSIDIYGFAFSTQVTSLTLGTGLTFIGNAAFADARLITTLTIPDGVSTIGGDAFVGATGITTLNYCGNADLTGTGLPNPSTNAATCTAAPPVSVTASARYSGASISFTPGANFGSTITNYQYSLDGGSFTAFSPAVTTSPVSITGLTNGTTYAVRLRAVNARGAGAASAPASVTPSTVAISQPAIGGVTAPASGATPVTTVTAANGYTGTVSWSGSPTTFAPSTLYTATITLTADTGYTFTGVTSNFFTVSGTSSVSNNANSGVITAVFPSTAVAAPAFSLSSTSETVTRGTAITGYTITSTGGTIASYSISPAISNTPGLAFDTTTGLISGTPTTTATARTYTITATNVTSPSATRTFSITVLDPPPSISIGSTSFNTASTSNLNVSLNDFDSTQNYQVTVKFVNASTNIEVSNGTLAATQGATRLISGYTSYSGTKIGFTGTYASIAAALATLTWTPASITNGISIRIGISSAPSTNEFYDANSGHYYRFMSTARTWLDARTVAEASYLYGLRGYLAEINTAAENNYIAKETSAKNIWIGAREDDTTTASWRTTSYNGSPGQRWIWNGAIQTPLPVGTGLIAQGTPAAFSSWSANEPNNDTKPGADCAVTNWGTNGLWNDLPCRNGYSFLIEFGGRPNEISTASAATLTETVTATNPILYTITYAPNNGNSTPTQASTSRGQSFTLANAITRSPSGGISYQFASWDNGSNSYRAGETFTVGTSNLTFTAAWIQLYEVTYIPNGGTFAGGDTNKDSECPLTICSNGQVITLNSAPTRTGYNFAGWKDQSGNFVTDTNSGTAGIQTTVSSTNYIFSAAWTVITYGVTYVSSGSAAPTQLALSTQETFTVGSDVTKAGYRFDGWSDGTYMWWSGDTYVMGTSDVTLTAQWTPIYSVTYSEGSGTGTPPVDTSIHLQGSTVEVPDDSGISKAGFTFGGWSDGSSVVQAGAFYLIGTSDVVLTAVWSSPQSASRTTTPTTPTTPTTTPKVWIIYFNRNGADSGGAPDAIKVLDSSNKTISLPGNIGGSTYPRPMAKKGFTFIGWSVNSTSRTALPSPFTVTSNATLYAIWGVKALPTPTPKPNATTNAQPTPVMVKVGTFYMASGSYFLNDATKSGLRTIAETINASGVKSILVYGHADSKGGVDNTILSRNRAKAVARFIRPLLNSKKISIGWFSSNKPVSTGKTPADLALNRRVEIYTR